MTVALRLTCLVAGHGGIPAVRGLSLEVGAGEVVALLGPNGAGKSTTLWTVAGVLEPLGGSVELFGEPLRSRPAHVVARKGVSLVPENRGLFYQLSVADNLRLHRHRGSSVTLPQVFDYFPALEGLTERRAGLLSGGEQQMLALACALWSTPRLLMIDEMSLGLAPIVVERLLSVVRHVADDLGMAVLVVEQHVQAALSVADRAYLMSHGDLVMSGTAAELHERHDVLEASYLGQASLG